MSRAYGYRRVSTDEQVDGASLENQKRAIKKYADENDIDVIGWYEDEGISAKTAHRPELQRMLDDIKKNRGKVDYVIVYNTSRISRNMESFSKDIAPYLTANGVGLRSTQETIDETPYGKFMKNLSISIHQLDNDIKSQTVSDNMKLVAQQGWWQSQAPYGMKIEKIAIGKNNDGKPKYRCYLVPNTTDNLSDKIALVINKFSSGSPSVADTLLFAQKIGLKGARGGELSYNTVDNILRSAAYAGYIRSERLTDNEIYKGNWEGIVSYDTYKRNQILLNRDKKAFNPLPDEFYPLKASALCLKCHRHLRGSAPANGSGKPSPRYHCTCKGVKSLQPQEAHEIFAKFLEDITPTDNTVKLFKEIVKRTAHRQLGSVNAEIKALRDEQVKIDNDIEKALQRLLDGDMTPEEKDIYVGSRTKRRSDLDVSIMELEDVQKINESTIEYVCNFITMPAKLWRDADYESRVAFQRMLFPDGFVFDTNKKQCGTEGLSPLYSVITTKKEPSDAKDSSLVISRGIEPRLSG